MTHARAMATAILASALALPGGAAHSGDPAGEAPTAGQRPAKRIYLDEHGNRVAPPRDADPRHRSSASSTPGAAPVVEAAPGGGIMIDPGERARRYGVARVGERGTAEMNCVKHPGGAAAK